MLYGEEAYKKRQEWLAALKPGDEVAVESHSMEFGDTYVLRKVVKVTPKRTRIDVVSEFRMDKIESYDKDGERRVGGTWGNTFRIHPVTDEIRENIKRARALSYIQRKVEEKDIRKLSTDALVKIANAIGGELKLLREPQGATENEDEDEEADG